MRTAQVTTLVKCPEGSSLYCLSGGGLILATPADGQVALEEARSDGSAVPGTRRWVAATSPDDALRSEGWEVGERVDLGATTIVRVVPFGYSVVHARKTRVEVGPYAQYARAVFVTCTEKGKRNPRTTVDDYAPSTVILGGHVAVAPPQVFEGGVARAPSCDPLWRRLMDEAVAAAVAAGARVLRDYRGAQTA